MNKWASGRKINMGVDKPLKQQEAILVVLGNYILLFIFIDYEAQTSRA
jgi:hypothetical protein